LKGLELNEQELDFDKPEDVQRLNLREKGLKTIPIKVGSFERHIFQKALNIKAKASDSLLRFELLKNELQIDSIDELQNKFLNDFEIQLVTQNVGFEDISNEEKLDMLLRFFDKLLFELKQDLNPHKGTAFKAGQFSDFFREAKEKSVVVSEKNERFYNEELKYKDWYVLSDFYGTSEEQKLIEFVQGTILNLKESYSEVYLLRNEELYKIYDFEKGRGFQPDFLLFLRQSKKMYYQIFIEPKGDNLLEIDKWKNDFLKEITEKYSDKNVLRAENKDYILIGLPFFNENENQEFAAAYNKLIN
jgi:type III restriction enzyme